MTEQEQDEVTKSYVFKMLKEARELIRNGKSTPRNAYHPLYGWLIMDGMLTETGEKFFKENIKPK